MYRQEWKGFDNFYNFTLVTTGSTFLLGTNSSMFGTEFNGTRNDHRDRRRRKVGARITQSIRNSENNERVAEKGRIVKKDKSRV